MSVLRHWDKLPREFSQLFTFVNQHICTVCIHSVVYFISAEDEQPFAKVFVLNKNSMSILVNVHKII